MKGICHESRTLAWRVFRCPAPLVQTLVDRALAAVVSTQLLQRVELKNDQMRITYEWRPDLLERIGGSFVTDAERPNLLRYQEYSVK